MFLSKIEKDTVGFATFLLKLFKTGFGLSVSWYPKCILNVSYSGAPFVFSCLISQPSDELRSNQMVACSPSLTWGLHTNKKIEIPSGSPNLGVVN